MSSPTLAVMAFTFLNSLGTGLVTSGISFITKQGFGFSKEANFLLALVVGATYIPGAIFAGRLVAWLRGRVGLSSRQILAWLMVVLASLCALPITSAALVGERLPPTWTIWVMVGLYSPLTGMLWPMVEAFLSGGRRGDNLRRTLGTWNIVWSGALVVAYMAAAPVIAPQPTVALLGLGATHVVALVILASFAREPAAHVHEQHAPAPASYERLLSLFRVLLPASYLVNSALTPLLAEVHGRFDISAAGQVWLATSWLIARPITFLVLGRWTGWHGSWTMPWIGAGLLLAGFAGAALSSRISVGTPGLVMQAGSLVCFGVGMATIYTGALYYAMEVGRAEVDAGGVHEALIGVGYTLGPLMGLVAAGLVATGAAREGQFEPIVLALVSAGAIGALGLGLKGSRRKPSSGASQRV